jgi:hypothetical protein
MTIHPTPTSRSASVSSSGPSDTSGARRRRSPTDASARPFLRRLLAAAAAVVVLGGCAGGPAEPPSTNTRLSTGTYEDFIRGVGTPHNEIWFSALKPDGSGVVAFDFSTTRLPGYPKPTLLVVGSGVNGTPYMKAVLTEYEVSTDPPSVRSPVGSVTWVEEKQAFHLVVDIPGYFSCDLWFTGHPGGAMEVEWDEQDLTWTQSLGTGVANGTIVFPGSTSPTEVDDWGAEQETVFGDWQLGPTSDESDPAETHVGYDYASSFNPDGSGHVAYVFPQVAGGWRGILAHTDASGEVTVCEPSQEGGVTLSGWKTDTESGFKYPTVMRVRCGDLDVTWTHLAVAVAQSETALRSLGMRPGWTETLAFGSSSVPGSVAILEHFRGPGYGDGSR